MPTRQTRGKRPAAKKEPAEARRWVSLTWDEVDHWAGGRSVARGRAYQRQGRVKDLAVAEDGRLLATVLGGDRYTVSVWREPGNRPRFMETLDRLEGRTILATQKAPRGKHA